MIVVKILTIASTLLVSMEQLVSMALEVSAAVVRPERLVYCAIWMMHALQTLAMPTPFVRQALSMAPSHVHALKDTKVLIVPRILTNVTKVNFYFNVNQEAV